MPLNELLVSLRDNYNIQFSFNDNELSKAKVTRTFTANSAENAISLILENTDFIYVKSGDVFLIYPAPKKHQKLKINISGTILDKFSREPLPFAHIVINNTGLVTDLKGNFNFVSNKDTLFKAIVSFLGYYMFETVLGKGSHTIELTPSSIGITEIVIEDQLINHSLQIGNKPGLMRLNNKIITALPGNGDNAVFNLLRLQPGILAAGEQSSDLVIWGSYEGQSQVLFDGFTIYGIKNFNDNISAVNPFMVKDMQIFKGAYDAKYGDKVGGIVDISGLDGSYTKPSVDLNINNLTLNAKINIPLLKKTSLTGAFRQTYYNLYSTENVVRNKGTNEEELILYPDYNFRDFNIKYAGKTDKGSNYYLSLYNGADNFNYSFDYGKINDKGNTSIFTKTLEEQNRQKGGAFFYNKLWNSGNSSNIIAGFSSLASTYLNHLNIVRLANGKVIHRIENTKNGVEEYFIKNENSIALTEQHAIDFGFGNYENKTSYSTDSLNVNLVSDFKKANRSYFYFQDNISVNSIIAFSPGIRAYYVFNLNKFYADPRISATINFNNNLKFNVSWGIHHQFIAMSSVIDENEEHRYLWAVCDNDKIPVLQSKHYVAGPSFSKKGLTVSLEGFYKFTDGLTRYKKISRLNLEDVFDGQSKSYGIDVFIKKEHKGHSVWLAYTLGKTLEHFSYFRKSDYVQAQHDQRHELKLASVLNFKSFYFSMNYVYGSGLPDPYPNNEAINSQIYSRFDIAGIYKLKIRKVNFESGISVLNVFNTQNLKYSSFVRLPSGDQNSFKIFTETVPFTPTLFVNISF